MKKILLSIIFALITLVTAFAADLNPFAYGLKSTYDAKTVTLSGEFYINAPANSVTTYAVDASGLKYLLQAYGKVSAKGKITFSYDLLKLRIPTNIPLTWCVEVVGQNPSSPTFVDNSNRLYAPYSVDIDNNPQNANFGTVFCVEGRPDAEGNSSYSSYLSYTDGAGIYVLNADGTARPIPNQSKLRYGYNGGRVKKGQQYFSGSSCPAHSPNRVRVSDCGRIFVTSFTPDGEVLWEINNEVFNTADQPGWAGKTEWGIVISDQNTNTDLQTTVKKDGGTDCNNHVDCNIYNLYNSSTGAFIAGPNVGFDVRGSGSNLKLLMLSACKQAIKSTTPAHFICSEYNLGNGNKWTTAPSRRVFKGHVLNYAGSQVQYDKSGNVWMSQYRATSNDDYPYTLLRVNTSGELDYKEKNKLYRRCGAIRFNEDFSQVVIASPVNADGGGFTLYPVDASTGLPIWDQGVNVNTYAKTGYSHMDYAWDYANNLYIAADNATNGERIAIYAMPRASEIATTPAASKYEFTIDCKPGVSYMVKTVCDANKGSVVCTPAEYANVVSTGMQVPSCTELTLTVTPKPTYKFINWTDQSGQEFSSSKTVTFSVSEALTLTANFEYAEYHNITWWNLFMNGEDIAKESTDYPNTNERLWRLFQVEYTAFKSKYNGANRDDKGTHTNIKQGSTKKQFDYAGWAASGTNRSIVNLHFLTNDADNSSFRWLGNYIEYVNVTKIEKTTNFTLQQRWSYFPYLFFNRADTAISSGANQNPYVNGVDYYKTEFWKYENGAYDRTRMFKDYGRPEYWRPYWTEAVCNLPMIMKYSDYMPTMNQWKTNPCAPGTVPGMSSTKETTPSDWYKWNTPEYVPALKEVKDDIILAWRNGSPTGEIVHHVWQDDMKLHVSYVLRHIDENDPPADPTNPSTPYDATNEDVIKLMQNPNWDPSAGVVATHNLTVTRKLVKGMYNTICLPFDVELNGLMDGHPLKGATLLSFSSIDDNLYNQSGEPVTVLNFTEVPEVTIGGKPCRILQAGIPYLIKVHEDVDEAKLLEEMRFTGIGRDVLILNAYSSETYRGVTFHGTINPTDIPEGSLILVADNRLALTTETGQMLGLRGYFTIDPMQASDIAEQAADGRVYLSFQKPTTTSIPVAPEAEQPKQPKVRKVMRDGQIYILRGDEVYTITGHRVK